MAANSAPALGVLIGTRPMSYTGWSHKYRTLVDEVHRSTWLLSPPESTGTPQGTWCPLFSIVTFAARVGSG